MIQRYHAETDWLWKNNEFITALIAGASVVADVILWETVVSQMIQMLVSNTVRV